MTRDGLRVRSGGHRLRRPIRRRRLGNGRWHGWGRGLPHLVERFGRCLPRLGRVRSCRVVARERCAAILAEAHAGLIAALAPPAGDILRRRRRGRREVHDGASERGLRVMELRAARQTEAIDLRIQRATARARVAFTRRGFRRELEIGSRRPWPHTGWALRCCGLRCWRLRRKRWSRRWLCSQRRLIHERGAAQRGLHAAGRRGLNHTLRRLQAVPAVHAECHMVRVFPPTAITPHSRQEDNYLLAESRICLRKATTSDSADSEPRG